MHSIKLRPDIKRRLTIMARERHITPDRLLNTAIQELLDDWEDLHSAQNALNNPEARYYSNEEVARELGL